MSRIRVVVMVAVAAIVGGMSLEGQGTAGTVTVYKDPTCGCCVKWIEHLRQHRFVTKVIEMASVDAVKTQNHVPLKAWSCHTALVNGYAIEGHVPAADIQRLLAERPVGIVGLAVPGMPIGSPGMEMPGSKVQPYNVVAFDKEGRTRVFATHGR